MISSGKSICKLYQRYENIKTIANFFPQISFQIPLKDIKGKSHSTPAFKIKDRSYRLY